MSDSQIRLQELDFEQAIARLTDAYYPRDWIDDVVANWLCDEKAGTLLLVGEPGTGKSALAAHVCAARANVCARHFCIDGQRATIIPGTALRSIAAQLTVSLPGYSEALANTVRPVHLSVSGQVHVQELRGGSVAAVSIGALGSADPVEEFDLLVRAPLAALPESTIPRLIVIDGLDEAVTFGGAHNLATLFADGGPLPAWVRILCTSRPERRVLRHFEHAQIVPLEGASTAAEADVAGYIGHRLALVSTEDIAIQSGRHELQMQLPKIAGGNFLYAKLVLDDWEGEPTATPGLLGIPAGLDSIYARHLRRFSQSDWEERYSLVLGTLAVAQEAVDETRLAQLSGLTRGQIRSALSVMVQFTRIDSGAGGQERYTLFHQSLRDFLLDAQANRDYWCDPDECHTRVVRALTHGSQPWKTDAYALRHLIFHLVATARIDDAVAMLRNFDYLEARLVQLGGWSLIDDVDLVLARLSSTDFRCVEMEQLRRFVLAQSSFLNSHPRSIMQQALNQPETSCVFKWAAACADGGRNLLRWINKPPTDPAISVLKGHEEWVVSCSWAPDERAAVSADARGAIKWWDTKRGECTATELRRGTDVLSWSGDGQRYVADLGSALAVVDARSGVMRQRLDLLARGEQADRRGWVGGAIEHCAWSTDERIFVWGRSERDLELWDVQTGATRVLRAKAKYPDGACALSPDGSRLAIAGGNASATIIDTATGQVVAELGSADWVVEGSVSSWTVFSGNRQGVECCAWSPDGLRVATAGGHGFGLDGDDFSVRIWDAITGQELACMLGHADRVNACCWSPDGSRLATASGSVMSPGPDNSVRVWDAIQYRQVAVFGGHASEVVFCSFSPDGTRLISASKDRSLRIWDATVRFAPDLRTHMMAVAPNGNVVALAVEDHAIALFDLQSLARIALLSGHEDTVLCLRWSPSGQRLATGSSDRTLRIWDCVTGQALAIGKGHQGETSYTAGGHRIEWGSVVDCDWAPDESRVASASNDGLVIIWDPGSGTMLLSLQGHTAPVASCGWTMEGRHVISHGGSFEHLNDPSIRLWDAALGTELGTIDADLQTSMRNGGPDELSHQLDAAMGVDAGPDHSDGDDFRSRKFAQSSDRTVVAVWRSDRLAREALSRITVVYVSDHRVRCELIGHTSLITACVWSQDAQRIASASEDGTVRLWDADTGEELAVFPTPSTVVDIAFCLDDTAIFALDEGGRFYVLQTVGILKALPLVPALPRFRFANADWDGYATGRCASCAHELMLELPQPHAARSLSGAKRTPAFGPVQLRCQSCGRECLLLVPEYSSQRYESAQPLNASSGQAWVEFATGLIRNKTDWSLAARAIARALSLDSQQTLTWHWRDNSAWASIGTLLREHGQSEAGLEADRRLGLSPRPRRRRRN